MASIMYEQLKQRVLQDDAAFESAFTGMTGALLGQKISKAFDEDVDGAKDAIGAILKYYRVKSREIPPKVVGLYPQLDYLLRPYGIMWREVDLIGDWTKDSVGALLGSWKDGGAVALLPRGIEGYDIYDASTGTRKKLTKAMQAELSNAALCFYKPFPMRAIGLKDLFSYMLTTLRLSDYTLIILATIAVTLVGLIPAYANKVLFTYVAGVDASLMPAVMCMLIGAILSSGLMGVIKTFVTERLNMKLEIACSAAAMARVLSLPATFFGKYNSGDLSERVENIKRLCTSLSTAIITTGLTGLFSLIYVTQIFSFAPSLCVPALLILLATTTFSVLSVLAQIAHTKKLMQSDAEIMGLQYALVTGVQKLRLTGAEKRGFSKWADKYKEQVKLMYNPPTFIKLNSVLELAISLAGSILIFFMAAKSGLDAAGYMAFNVSYGLVSGAFLSMAGVANTIAGIKPMLDMIKPLLEATPETSEDKEELVSVSGSIELNNVSFRYNQDQPYLLYDITLKIRAGQYVAIVGRTGCGKSTLMKLLLGFETPEKGSVYFDGRDLRGISARSLRKHIGVVTQDGQLFQGDIYQNITISAPELTVDEAWNAAEMAGIADDIRDMPMGMFTMISEDSGGVSGGQKQRLMIARAIAPKPRILLFDEATSALDNITQKKVSDSLDGLKCTRLVIAHRLSTIRHCDRILVLDHGRIVEDGKYEDLIAKNGEFADLVSRQRLDESAYVGKTPLY